jgi:hypothetical protein
MRQDQEPGVVFATTLVLCARPHASTRVGHTLFTMSNSRRLQSQSPAAFLARSLATPSNLVLLLRSVCCARHPLIALKALVEADGIEPTTPCLQSRCSPTELRPRLITPAPGIRQGCQALKCVVGPGRFELPTSRLSSARSNQLSYEPGSLDPPNPRPHTQRTRAWLSFRIGKGCAGGGMSFDRAAPGPVCEDQAG